jgi:hypothetical protein
MNFGEVLTIEDLGNHSVATVIELGILLAGTVNVTPDLKRRNFYEVEHGSTVYYIHVSSVSGTIYFLATWKKHTASRTQAHLASSVSYACFVPGLSAESIGK